MAYNGYITTIKELREHSNADRLKVATVFGNDVIVSLDYEIGDKVVYFPTDGKLSEEYAKENKLTRSMGGYLDDDKRHVTSIKLRGEKSDGLLMKAESLYKFTNVKELKDGDIITALNGVLICEKYIPKYNQVKLTPNNKDKKRTEKRNEFPFFEQHIDTAQLAYNLGQFKEGDLVTLTLKLHGTSQRTAHTIKSSKERFLHKIFKSLLGVELNKKWEYVTGTRRVTLESFNGGFYGSNKFRKQWHDVFVGKLPKGMEVFYEVVGYTDDGALIMPECDNKKTKDKEFVKQYGEKTQFTYGCGVGQSDIYVYRINMTDLEGYVYELPTELAQIWCDKIGVKHVPMLDKFIFTTTEDLLERISKHENGADLIGKTHIREGIIARIENREKFTALKQKNFNFKVLEGIIKSEDVLDMEEENSETIE